MLVGELRVAAKTLVAEINGYDKSDTDGDECHFIVLGRKAADDAIE